MTKNLSLRHIQILELLANGYMAKEIATQLGIVEKTVEVHKTNMMRLMKCRTSAQMVAEAMRQNLLSIMERNTITPLGQLRIGDRYCYNNRIDVWQVMRHTPKGKVAVNQIAFGKPIHKFDEVKAGNILVRFMRHTQPLPGEKCIVEDLQPGDVFFMPEDIITEYTIVPSRQDIPYWLETAVNSRGVRCEVEKNKMVTLVRKAKEVVA